MTSAERDDTAEAYRATLTFARYDEGTATLHERVAVLSEQRRVTAAVVVGTIADKRAGRLAHLTVRRVAECCVAPGVAPLRREALDLGLHRLWKSGVVERKGRGVYSMSEGVLVREARALRGEVLRQLATI